MSKIMGYLLAICSVIVLILSIICLVDDYKDIINWLMLFNSLFWLGMATVCFEVNKLTKKVTNNQRNTSAIKQTKSIDEMSIEEIDKEIKRAEERINNK